MTLVYTTMASPVGELKLIANAHALVAVLWKQTRYKQVDIHSNASEYHSILIEAKQQLQQYFQKKRQKITIALDFQGSVFQNHVWSALLTIPYGETRTYSELAHMIGRPKAVRAVGGACSRNPISIIIPCHRIVGANGLMTGFIGGPIAKTMLLDLEKSPS
jgi:methylated-DNA-[protein]-cysteine S-methyltransferase